MSDIILIGANHQTAPVEVREKLAFSPDQIRDVLEWIKRQEWIREGLLVSTCNRTEFIFVPARSDCRIQEKLGICGQMCMDVSAACSGFLYAMQTARGYLMLEPDARILVVTSEVISRRVNWEDRTTCVLFGDASGAVVLSNGEKGEGPHVVDIALGADGTLGDLLTVNGGGSAWAYRKGQTVGDEFFVQMKGREIFKHAVRNMCAMADKVLADNALTKDDVDVLIPHQANWRIIDAVGRKFEIPEEKVYSNVARYGNTSAASVPLALAEAVENGFVKKGNLVLMPTFGGGFTWGAGLIRF